MSITTIVIQVAALVIALTLHEFAHAWMGDYLGDPTARHMGRLSLNPLSHIDPLTTLALPLLLILSGSPVVFAAAKPVPFNPWAVKGGRWGAALVAFAGPATNLLIAVFFSIWLRLMPSNLLAYQILGTMIIINISLFVFNMIPFPPLDGSRLLYAVAPPGLRDIMDRIEKGGMVVLFLIIFVGYQFIAPFIGKITIFILGFLFPGTPLP
jgi:Zn-dependent protease